MNILIIGNGGREHALAWKASQSPLSRQVWVAPGNGGTALAPHIKNVNIPATDIDQLVAFAQRAQIDLTIVGPESSLSLGIVDAFQAQGLRCFGPTKAAAQLEASKQFSKDFMRDHQIPTAPYACFTDAVQAKAYVREQGTPLVIKADGLAAGKGVIIAQTIDEAYQAIDTMMSARQYGEAGLKVVIEKFLKGEEISFIAISDGHNIIPLASSQDHKRRDNNNLGPNTGGMGAYSPAWQMTDALEQKIMSQIMAPTVEAMANRGTPYIGFLYAGLMMTDHHEPNVLEFNCRLGDPETQAILMRLDSDIIELCMSALTQQLRQHRIQWNPKTATTVVMATSPYPDTCPTGATIQGICASDDKELMTFHAGTQLKDNILTTSGGRVLSISALGDNIASSRERAYEQIKKIHWPEAFYRTDIGAQALANELKIKL